MVMSLLYFMGASDAVDVHVLKETILRITSLSNAVLKSSEDLMVRSENATKSLKPATGAGRNIEQYKKNVNAVLESIRELKQKAVRIEKLSTIIKGELAVPNLEQYLKAVSLLANTHRELSSSNLSVFRRLISTAEELQIYGRKTLEVFLQAAVEQAFPEFDPMPYLDSKEPVPPFSVPHLGELQAVVSAFDRCNSPVKVDDILNPILVSRVASLLKAPADHVIMKDKSAFAVKRFNGFCEELIGNFQTSLNIVLGASSRKDVLLRQLDDVVLNVRNDVSKKLSSAVVASQESGSPWAVFDAIESSHITNFTQEELDGFKATALAKLKQTLADIPKKVQSVQLTSETGVAGVTVQILTQLRSMAAHKTGVQAVLASEKIRSWIPIPEPAWVQPLTSASAGFLSMEIYFADCLDALMYNFREVVQAHFKEPPKQGLCMLVQHAQIEESLKNSVIGPAAGDAAIQRLQRYSKVAMKDFMTEWNALASLLMDSTVIANLSDNKGKLSSKEREVVKEKFRQFNSEFENLVERHRRYNITDAELRAITLNEISRVIKPMYQRFYDKHSSGDFTKNVEKYIKWDKQQFDAVLQSLA